MKTWLIKTFRLTAILLLTIFLATPAADWLRSVAFAAPVTVKAQKLLGERGFLPRFDYTLGVNSTAVEDLDLENCIALDPIDVGGLNQCRVGLGFTYSDATAITMTCDDHIFKGSQKLPIQEGTKNATGTNENTITTDDRTWRHPTGSVDGIANFDVPVLRRFLTCTVCGSGATANDLLNYAVATCGVM